MKRIVLKKILFAGLLLFLCALPAKYSISQAQQPNTTDRQSKEQLAHQYYREQQWEKAAALYKELYELQPQSYYYRYYIFCEMQLNNYQALEKFVQSAIRKNPANSLMYEVDLGYIYNATGDLKKGAKKYEEVIAGLAKNPQQVHNVSSSFQTWREIKYAIRAYQKVREVNGDPSMYALELVNLYNADGEYQLMSDELINYAVANPQQLNSLKNRIQSILANDDDGVKKEVIKRSLIRYGQKNPEQIEIQDMLVWMAIQEKDFSLAYEWGTALDKRLNDDGRMMMNLGDMALSNGDYEMAYKTYQYVAGQKKSQNSYTNARIKALDARYQSIINNPGYKKSDLLSIEADYLGLFEEFGKNKSTILLMKSYAHLLAFYLDRKEDAISVLNEALEIPQAPAASLAACKMELADIYILTGDVWDALLLYSQVDKAFKNNPIGYEAKYKNAKLSFYMGEFEWANAQLKVLKAATDRFIANDAIELSLVISDNMESDSTYEGLRMYAHADLLIAQHKYDEALAALDEIPAYSILHSLNDDVIMKKAEIAVAQFQHQQADSLLAKLVSQFPTSILVDNALFQRAQLNENILKNPQVAIDCYREIITQHSGSIFASESRKQMRILRGETPEAQSPSPEEQFFYGGQRPH